MTQRDPGVYLEAIERCADAAVRFTSGFTLEQYLGDEKSDHLGFAIPYRKRNIAARYLPDFLRSL